MLSAKKWFNTVLAILDFCLPLDFDLAILSHQHFVVVFSEKVGLTFDRKWKSKSDLLTEILSLYAVIRIALLSTSYREPCQVKLGLDQV